MSITNPVVSIIIPNYNHAQFLEQRLESVLNQTYTNVEVIILDDNSTDNSRDILDQYLQHPKVSGIYYNTINSGTPFTQWQKGIELAKGQFIWIAESDDYSETNFLEKLIQKINAKAHIDMAFCESHFVNEQGEIIHQKETSKREEIFTGKEFIEKMLTFGNGIYNASMAIFRKNLFERITDKSYLNFNYCGDWYFWILLCEKCNLVYHSGEPLNYFRRHEKSVSSNSDRKGTLFIEGERIMKKLSESKSFKQKLFIQNGWARKWSIQKFPTLLNLKIVLFYLFKFPLVILFFLRHKILR